MRPDPGREKYPQSHEKCGLKEAAMSEISAYFASLSIFQAGLLASLIAGTATGIGALPIFAFRNISPALRDILLGAAAGLMLGATVFSLILPAIEAQTQRGDSESLATVTIGFGIMAGALLLWLFDWLTPHEHLFKGKKTEEQNRIRGVWLFVIAITIHNFPEGLAVGVGFGGGNVANGLTLTAAIFLQNLPSCTRSCLNPVQYWTWLVTRIFVFFVIFFLISPIGYV